MDTPKITSLEQFRPWAAEQGYPSIGATATEDNWWMKREIIRLERNYYTPIPHEIHNAIREHTSGSISFPTDHWVHASKEQPGMIAYTPDVAHGKADRQIRTKLGRYLKKASGLELSEPAIASIGCLLRSLMEPPTLLIARTQEEIAMVYDKGPRSCMGGEGRNFSADVAPVRVFAGPDTAVAYITREGRITARTIIRTDTYEWIRMYGDEIALESALDAEGYSEGDGLAGCRLADVEYDGRTVMPYLDGCAHYVDSYHCPEKDKTYWRVVDCGDWSAQSEYGFLDGECDESRSICESCEDYVSDDCITHVASEDRYICNNCVENNYSMVFSGRYQELMHEENTYIIGEYNGDLYTLDGVEWHGLILIDDGIYDSTDVSEDGITGDMILSEDSTTYVDAYGDDAHTLETSQLVRSTIHDCNYCRDDVYHMKNGDYVLEDSREAQEDVQQLMLIESEETITHAKI